MKCEAILDLLAAYLEGEVTSEERGRVDAHLSVCQHCRQELAAMSSIQRELRLALKEEAEGVSSSPYAWQKLRTRLSATSNPSFWDNLVSTMNRPLWRAVAASAVILVLAFAVVLRMGALPTSKSASAPAPEMKSAQAPSVAGAMPAAPAPAPTGTPKAVPQTAPTMAADAVGAKGGSGPAGPTGLPSPDYGTLLNIIVQPAQSAYLSGKDIDVGVTVSNVSSQTVTVRLPPEVRIRLSSPAGTVSTVRTIVAGKQYTRLEPGASVSYDVIWDQKDDAGAQVRPGQYYVEVVIDTKLALADQTVESRTVTTAVLIKAQ